jgi:KRAB domain-containing zinc finger protein
VKIHITAVHSEDKLYHCNSCQYRCKTQNYLSKHHLAHHTETESTPTGPSDKFQCETCNKKLTSKRNLDSHRLTHESNRPRPFKCEKCGKTFSQRTYLQKHNRMKERSQKCNTENPGKARDDCMHNEGNASV